MPSDRTEPLFCTQCRSTSIALRRIAADVRALGDAPLVRLDDDGVTPIPLTLADELWLLAFNLDPEGTMADARAQ